MRSQTPFANLLACLGLTLAVGCSSDPAPASQAPDPEEPVTAEAAAESAKDELGWPVSIFVDDRLVAEVGPTEAAGLAAIEPLVADAAGPMESWVSLVGEAEGRRTMTIGRPTTTRPGQYSEIAVTHDGKPALQWKRRPNPDAPPKVQRFAKHPTIRLTGVRRVFVHTVEPEASEAPAPETLEVRVRGAGPTTLTEAQFASLETWYAPTESRKKRDWWRLEDVVGLATPLPIASVEVRPRRGEPVTISAEQLESELLDVKLKRNRKGQIKLRTWDLSDGRVQVGHDLTDVRALVVQTR